MERVDLRPYIDEIQMEINRISAGERPKTQGDWEIELERLQAILRGQSRRLSRELGMAGSPTMLFMLLSGVLSIAWTSFAIRTSSTDEKRPFEQRIELVELLAGLPNALSSVIEKSSEYADVYKK